MTSFQLPHLQQSPRVSQEKWILMAFLSISGQLALQVQPLEKKAYSVSIPIETSMVEYSHITSFSNTPSKETNTNIDPLLAISDLAKVFSVGLKMVSRFVYDKLIIM